MAEEPHPERGQENHDGPSLELPSLRGAFRRRRTPQPAPTPLVTTPAAASRETVPLPAPEPEREPEPRRRRRRPVRLHFGVPGPVAALLTGAVVGLALVGLTSATLRLCTAWRGTSSCGNPGILLLLAIVVATMALGALALRLLGVATAASTSLLGVGLLGVVVLLALLPVLDRGWMVVAVPLLSMLTHLAAWWLTTTYVEPGDRPR